MDILKNNNFIDSVNSLKIFFKRKYFNKYFNKANNNILVTNNKNIESFNLFEIFDYETFESKKINSNDIVYIDKNLNVKTKYPEINLEYINNLNNIDMTGFFSVENQSVLRSLVREKIKNIDKPKILEIGSWKGLSSSIIAEELKTKGSGKLYCIDAWETVLPYSETAIALQKELDSKDIYGIFKNNMKKLELWEYITVLHGFSDSFHEILKDEYFDIIFIDGEHSYIGAKSDIKNYLPKLNKSGLILGDDCEVYASMLPSSFIENNYKKDYALLPNNMDIHCGVVKVLEEEFKTNYKHHFHSSVWSVDLDNKKFIKNKKCPICSHEKLSKRDFFNKIAYYECENCNFYFSEKLDKEYIVNQRLDEVSTDWLEHRILMIEKYIIPRKDNTIFEIGCAKGDLLVYYKSKGCKVSGCDASKYALNNNLNIKSEFIENIDLPNESLDIIFSFHTLEVIQDLENFLKKSYSSLKKDGSLLLLLSLNHSIDNMHSNYFTDKSLRIFLEKSSFNIKEMDYEIFRNEKSQIFRNTIVYLKK